MLLGRPLSLLPPSGIRSSNSVLIPVYLPICSRKVAARLLLFREPIGQFSLFPRGKQFSLGAFGITSLTVEQTANVCSPAELAKLAHPALSRGEFRPFTFTVRTDTAGSNKLSRCP